jgi:hypothetical protein
LACLLASSISLLLESSINHLSLCSFIYLHHFLPRRVLFWSSSSYCGPRTSFKYSPFSHRHSSHQHPVRHSAPLSHSNQPPYLPPSLPPSLPYLTHT